MYAKIFDSMYEGTLHGHWEAIVTMQQMLVLCDQNGVIDMTPQAIASRTSIPLAIIEKGIEILSGPDPYSRTPGEDGKRIATIDEHRPWGWYIVNHEKYQRIKSHEDKLEADRQRIAEKRKKIKDVAKCRGQSQNVESVANVAHSDSDSDSDIGKHSRASRSTLNGSFTEFWSSYPNKKAKAAAEKSWLKINPDEDLTKRILSAVDRAKTSEDWEKDEGRFIPHPATWLNNRRWEDELFRAPVAARRVAL